MQVQRVHRLRSKRQHMMPTPGALDTAYMPIVMIINKNGGIYTGTEAARTSDMQASISTNHPCHLVVCVIHSDDIGSVPFDA
jgi:hypothetical protein